MYNRKLRLREEESYLPKATQWADRDKMQICFSEQRVWHSRKRCTPAPQMAHPKYHTQGKSGSHPSMKPLSCLPADLALAKG